MARRHKCASLLLVLKYEGLTGTEAGKVAAAEMCVKSSSQPSVCSWHGSSGSADPPGAPSRSAGQAVAQGGKLLFVLLYISTFLPGNVSESEKKVRKSGFWLVTCWVFPPLSSSVRRSQRLCLCCIYLPLAWSSLFGGEGWAEIRELLFASSSPLKNTAGRLLPAILCV